MSAQLSTESKDHLPAQDILDLYKHCFHTELYEQSIEILLENVQKVKGRLYDRDYEKAFSEENLRVAYCARWSPSRSISYAALLTHLQPVREVLGLPSSNILCIGGGAGGELVALASIITLAAHRDQKKHMQLNLIDIADWNPVISKLNAMINEKWLYGSASKSLDVQFIQENVLNSQVPLEALNLVTIFFTANELVKEDRGGSVRFLQRLNSQCPSGCLLLVVESAGSYSHISIGTHKFPIQFLIDTVLLGKRNEGDGPWRLLQDSDSMWYRASTKLDYKLKIENMRFFFKLYQKK